MSSFTLSRRRCLALLAAAPAAASAAFETDGPARPRPLAEKGVLLDLQRAGRRLVAVGERGHVLLSDDDGRQWRQAAAVPTRSTLTALHASDARTLWAVGHGGLILRSADAGERWSSVFGQADGREVLLSIRVEPDGRGLAVGGYGHALATSDGGASWKRVELLAGEAGEKHLNRLFVSRAGHWLIAAEGGTVLRSERRDAPWQALQTPYAGSLWSGTALSDGTLVACGMRGNLVRSSDEGRTWVHRQVSGAGSLTAVADAGAGRCLLVGVDGTVIASDAGGEKLHYQALPERVTLTGVVLRADGVPVASTTSGLRTLPRIPGI